MNVFKYEMIQNKKTALSWCIALPVFSLIFISFAPVFMEESELLMEFMEGLGPIVTDALGVNIETLFSSVGFYTYVFNYISMMAAVQAMMLGMTLISKEYRMKTADFLLTKPVSRGNIYLQKLGSGAVVLFITLLVFFLITYAGMAVVTEGDFAKTGFQMINLSLGFVQLFFFSAGICLAILLPKIKSVVTISVGLVFLFFFLGMVTSLTESEWMRYAAPLKYFDSNYILLNNSYETTYVVLSLGLSFAMLIAGYVLYLKKDIPSV